MLRSVPDKLLGVLIMLSAIIVLAIFPFFIKIKNIAKLTIFLDNYFLEYKLQLKEDLKNKNIIKDFFFLLTKSINYFILKFYKYFIFIRFYRVSTN